jgi:hypothetical protein
MRFRCLGESGDDDAHIGDLFADGFSLRIFPEGSGPMAARSFQLESA